MAPDRLFYSRHEDVQSVRRAAPLRAHRRIWNLEQRIPEEEDPECVQHVRSS